MAFRTPNMNGLTALPDATGSVNNPAASSEECEGHCWWGRWEEPSFLPNASDNPATGPAYRALRPGDWAYAQAAGMSGGVQGVPGLYELVDRGTDNGGDAVWIRVYGNNTTRFFGSPTAADFYQSANGVAPGSDDFIVAVHTRWESLDTPGGGAVFRLADNLSANAGWEINWVFGAFAMSVWDGGGVQRQGFMGGTWWDANAGFAYMQNRDVLVHMRVFQGAGGTEIQGLINGALALTAGGVSLNVTPSAGPMRFLGGASPWLGGGHGIAYYDGTLTDRELLAHADACLGQGRLVANGIPWDNLWNANDHEPGAIWTPTLGADDLTEQGTIELFTRYRRPG